MQRNLQTAHPVLPRELVNRESSLTKLIVIAGDMSVIDPNRAAVVSKTQAILRHACRSYQPSVGGDDLLCRSGEETGFPYRGKACSQCTVGQFSKSMFFVGTISPAAKSRSESQLGFLSGLCAGHPGVPRES